MERAHVREVRPAPPLLKPRHATTHTLSGGARVPRLLRRRPGDHRALGDARPKNKAEEIAEKIQKQVEKLRGLEFKQPVKIGVYDKATLKAALLKLSEKELSDARLGPYQRGLKALALIPQDLDFKKVYCSTS